MKNFSELLSAGKDLRESFKSLGYEELPGLPMEFRGCVEMSRKNPVPQASFTNKKDLWFRRSNENSGITHVVYLRSIGPTYQVYLGVHNIDALSVTREKLSKLESFIFLRFAGDSAFFAYRLPLLLWVEKAFKFEWASLPDPLQLTSWNFHFSKLKDELLVPTFWKISTTEDLVEWSLSREFPYRWSDELFVFSSFVEILSIASLSDGGIENMSNRIIGVLPQIVEASGRRPNGTRLWDDDGQSKHKIERHHRYAEMFDAVRGVF